MKKISVIVPTYNRADALSIALVSLIEQNYDPSHFEIIIVDNNSCDNTRQVVDSCISQYPLFRIRYVYEGQQGLVHARHSGAKAAQFDILSFTDDDAILSRNWLKEICRVFEMNEQVAAVAGKITIRWDETPPDWVIPYEDLLGKLDYGDEVRIEQGLWINGGNFNVKKSVLLEVGGFNPDQIGDWLIGDGETGLCRKLHNAGYLIGWAPDALMEHCQSVKKNATTRDIRRRFINNGRGIPYNIYAIQKQGWFYLFLNLFHVSGSIIRLSAIWILSILKSNQEMKYSALFNIAYCSCQFPYTFKLLFDRKFRALISKSNWW